MFRTVGPQPPRVYWRRRLALLATLVVLLALIMLITRAVLSNGGAASGTHTSAVVALPSPTAAATRSAPNRSKPSRSKANPSTTSSVKAASRSASGSSSRPPVPPKACLRSQLVVSAVTNQTSYTVGDTPVLMMQVTNEGKAPCIQDLADSQVVLRVYNGVSRVWGSHDCQLKPGVDDRTLLVAQSVRISIVWSGLSSQVGCAGTRQRVGAGSYTLIAGLAGTDGVAAQFTIS
jgi:hypothetical protein